MLLNKKSIVAIKTYTHECGLWYLAQSLHDKLISEGHIVYFIPKSKYSMEGSSYYRVYDKPKNPLEFKKYNILNMNPDVDISNQILNYCVKYDIDTIISMETFIMKSSWILSLKNKKKVKFIDVPMIEWVPEKNLVGGSYKIFDEIWCLTNQCKKYFDKYDYQNTKKITWDFTDSKLFNKSDVKNSSEELLWFLDAKYKFLHCASTSEKFSHKNTDNVIKAFNELDRDDSKLLITGFITDKESLKIIEKNKNIKCLQKIIARDNISDYYKISDYTLAPSIKEGLGLSLYEAMACNSIVVTTDAEPMNELSNVILIKPTRLKSDGSLIIRSEVSFDAILKKLIEITEDDRD